MSNDNSLPPNIVDFREILKKKEPRLSAKKYASDFQERIVTLSPEDLNALNEIRDIRINLSKREVTREQALSCAINDALLLEQMRHSGLQLAVAEGKIYHPVDWEETPTSPQASNAPSLSAAIDFAAFRRKRATESKSSLVLGLLPHDCNVMDTIIQLKKENTGVNDISYEQTASAALRNEVFLQQTILSGQGFIALKEGKFHDFVYLADIPRTSSHIR